MPPTNDAGTETFREPNSNVLTMLRENPDLVPWLDYLEWLGASPIAWKIPTSTELGGRLTWCGVPFEAFPAIEVVARQVEASADLTWLLDRCVHQLWHGMDHWERPPQFPRLPNEMGEVGRWFFAVVFATYLPFTLDLHRVRGVSAEISQATMADIGRHVQIFEARHGKQGLADPDWLWLHARGMIYQLGRLQFERAPLGKTTTAALRTQGYDYEVGEPVLSVHIPSFMGGLDPAACDASFAQAREFYAQHYPEETYRLAVCKSWLMDQQLAEFLPETSNIVQFQRRFGLAYTPEQPDDRDTLEFVFRTPEEPLDALPQRTSLERAVVAHLRAGRHFYGGMGWLPLI